MAFTADTVCAAWATQAELLIACTSLPEILSELPAGTVTNALLAASDALYTLSGRVFTGLCTSTVVPYYDYCTPQRTKVNIGLWPVHSVVSVLSGVTAVDPATYALRGFKYLQFTGEVPADLTVSVQYGMIPPLLGKEAVLALACEILAAHMGEECSLPSGITGAVTRQGITQDMINPNDLLENGRTGIYAVDRFLMIYNPKNLPSPAFVLSGDTMSKEHIPADYNWPYGARRY